MMASIDSSGTFSLIKRLPELEVTYAVACMGGSEILYVKMFMQVVRLIPSNLAQMDAFLQAGGALDQFAIKAHGMKSAFKQAGHPAFAQAAEALETAAKAGDRAYCEQHYVVFKKQLQQFHERVTALLPPQGALTAEAGQREAPLLRHYAAAITQAQSCADNYDAVSAADLLRPLMAFTFGGSIDSLLAQATEALDMFQYRQALALIARLLDETR